MNDDELPEIQVDVHEEGGRVRAGRNAYGGRVRTDGDTLVE